MSAPAFVQKADGTLFGGVSTPSASLAYPNANTLGNLLIALVSWMNPASSNPNTIGVTVTDTQGNVWKPLARRHSNQTIDEVVQLWYCIGSKAGANTVLFTFDSPARWAAAAILEYSGVNALDNSDYQTNQSYYANANSSAVNPAHSTVAATHDSTELVIAYAQSGNYRTWTPSSGWTLRTSPGDHVSGIQVAVADQIAGNGTYCAAFSLDQATQWTAGTVTFYQKDSAQFVQETDHDDGVAAATLSDTMAFADDNQAGDLLFLNYVWLNDVPISSVTDTQGNTWIPLPRQTLDSITFQQAWYCLGCKAGPNAVTVQFGGAGASWIGASISEWSDVSYLDGFAQQAQITNTPVSPILNTTVAGDLLIAYGGTRDGFVNITSGPGFTARTASHRSLWLASKYAAPIGSYIAAPTGDGGSGTTGGVISKVWGVGIAAFSATQPPPPPPPPPPATITIQSVTIAATIDGVPKTIANDGSGWTVS